MNSKHFWVRMILVMLLLLNHLTTLQAQDSNNVLGLPAVPQGPKASASAVSPSSKVLSKPSEADVKAALSGSLKLASFYPEGLLIVRVSTEKTFLGNAPRTQAIQAARLVQRDARLACGKLCKTEPMPAPTLQTDNTLSFDIVISGYAGVMSTADMVNLVSGKRVGKSVNP